MLRTFNCGIGMVVAVARDGAEAAIAALRDAGEAPVVLGEVVAAAEGEPALLIAESSRCDCACAPPFSFPGAAPTWTRSSRRRARRIIRRRSRSCCRTARDAAGLSRAKTMGVATAAVDHKIYAGREEFERSMQLVLEAHRIEFLCLAGFMRMLTPWFVSHWRGRMLNVHPALLPAYRGLDTHARALHDGVKIHGCTVHFVVPQMDEGPIVAQAAVRVAGRRHAGKPRRARARARAQDLSAGAAARGLGPSAGGGQSRARRAARGGRRDAGARRGVRRIRMIA